MQFENVQLPTIWAVDKHQNRRESIDEFMISFLVSASRTINLGTTFIQIKLYSAINFIYVRRNDGNNRANTSLRWHLF